MANVLPREKRIEVLRHLVEGSSMRATSRITGVHLRTIQNLLISFGSRCAAFMDRKFRGLHLNHIETDEIWTYAAKHQRFLTAEEKATCHDILLPKGRACTAVLVDGSKTAFKTVRAADSVYVDVEVTPRGTVDFEILF